MRRSIVIVAGLLAMLLTASSASAASCPSNRDVAAIDQYCAVIPSADGQDSMPWRGSGERLEMGVSPRVVARLKAAGPLGQALLTLPLGAPKARIKGEGRPSAKELAELERVMDAGPFKVDEGAVSLKEGLKSVVSAVGDENAISGTLRWALVGATFGLFGLAGTGAQLRRTHP